MAFTDLSPQAQQGFAYAATLLKGDGSPQFKSAEAAADAAAEKEGCAYFEQSKQPLRVKRVAVLEDAKYAALAVQVDAAVAVEDAAKAELVVEGISEAPVEVIK